jgi:hypothetical protein
MIPNAEMPPTSVEPLITKTQPSSALSTSWIPFLLFLFSGAYLCLFLRYSSLEPDEGIIFMGAERVLHGQVPYRDFFSFYTPGSFYLLALWFKLFGYSFLAARASLTVVGALCTVLLYLLSLRVCSRSIAIFTASLSTFAVFPYRFLVLHNWYSTLLACLATYSAVQWLETRSSRWAFATGCFCSLTVLFEQSKGVGLCLGLLLGFGILRVRKFKSFERPEWAWLAIGSLWPVFLTLAYFGSQHALNAMEHDLLWPLHHYGVANHVPYGYQNWSARARDVIFHVGPIWQRAVKVLAVSPGLLVPMLPLVALCLLPFWAFRTKHHPLEKAKSDYYTLICSVLAGLLLSVTVTRADVLHFMYLAPLSFLPLAWMLDANAFLGSRLATLRPYLMLAISVTFGLMTCALLVAGLSGRNQVETRHGSIRTSQPDTVIGYVQAHNADGDEILVYPYLPLYYYLTGTHSPSRYDYFQPGMNTIEQAREIIANMESHQVRTVIFEPGFMAKIPVSWPNTPLGAVSADPVSQYIMQNYRACKTLTSPSGWEFEYMVRAGGRCP